MHRAFKLIFKHTCVIMVIMMETENAAQTLQKKVRKTLSRYILFLFISVYVAGMSVMAFDAPGSEKNILVWATVLPVFVMPLSLLIAIVVGWSCYFLKRYTCANWLIKIPKYNLYVIVIGIVIMAIAGIVTDIL